MVEGEIIDEKIRQPDLRSLEEPSSSPSTMMRDGGGRENGRRDEA